MQLGERRAFRWGLGLFLVAGIGASFVGSDFNPFRLVAGRALENAGTFFRDALQPRLDGAFVAQQLGLALDTLAIAFLGTLCAILLGLPLALLGSRNVTRGALALAGESRAGWVSRVTYAGARGVAALARSIPELVWAYLFVNVFGLGPTPAILALGLAYGGMLAKVYSERIEETRPEAAVALEAAGAGRFSAALWGILPGAFAPLASYTTYRFECAVRASALMGFVGAGGIGTDLQISMKNYEFDRVSTQLIVLIGLVAVLEIVADQLQRRIS